MVKESCIRECTAKRWQDAKEILLSISSRGRVTYFRGQADAAWVLESSFARLMKNLARQSEARGRQQKTPEEVEVVERALRERFRDAYQRIPGASRFPEKEDEYEALAQHYSLPTRLLDWSRSPYIAAFFAFDGCKTSVFPQRHNVAIWALDWDMFELCLYYNYRRLEPDRPPSERPEDLRAKLRALRQDNWPRIDRVETKGNPNRRLVYQEGLFTRAIKAEDDVEMYLRNRSQFAPGTALTKITIPGDQQAEALGDLDLMTISPVTLMNDPQGAAATAFNSVVRFELK